MSRPLSSRAIRALGLFGVEPAPADDPCPGLEHSAGVLARALCPGDIALITGPSGAGKSRLLGAVASRLGACARVSPIGLEGDRAVIDLVPLPLERAISMLGMAGLADATILARRAADLSEGQRHRLALARAMARADRHRPLIADELASNLDPRSAHALARTLRRWARRARAIVVGATARDDILEYLAPSVLAIVTPHAVPTLLRRGDGGTLEELIDA